MYMNGALAKGEPDECLIAKAVQRQLYFTLIAGHAACNDEVHSLPRIYKVAGLRFHIEAEPAMVNRLATIVSLECVEKQIRIFVRSDLLQIRVERECVLCGRGLSHFVQVGV